MILDNLNKNLKIYEWIEQNIHNGSFDIVTGYFTIGAIAFLSEKTNNKIEEYRFIIGDIVSTSDQKVKSLDLLNENIDTETATKLSEWARIAVDFLKQNKVSCKTLEPNFCHAKLYLSKNEKNNPMLETYIMGSSNLTEAGIGIKNNQNIELNSAGTGTEPIYNELKDWFNNLWDSPKAHLKKTIIDSKGKEKHIDFKQYLIDEISKIFKLYEPIDIYHKILFELFNEDNDSPEIEKQLIKLEDTIIYNKLYDFQKGGVRSLIRMLNKYNGAILADAVGLGKTWSALAVMKSFQNKADVLLLCPKKLEQNWRQYLKKNNSIFEEDKIDFDIKFHTDLRVGGFDDNYIQYLLNDKSKLIVIDESHNLRNDKSSRYKFFIEEILQKSKGNIKILLLSATPINNSFKDIRNQFKLMSKGENTGFKETLEVNNIETTFREVQKIFNEWRKEPIPKLDDFHSKLKDSSFFKLTDHLLVARTRKNVKTNFDRTLSFPKHKDPINIFKTPLKFGDVESFAELLENLDLNLSAYLPVTYTFSKAEREKRAREKAERKAKNLKGEKDDVLKDDVQREHFLVKMMMILMLKRLESSWYSFEITVKRIYHHHQKALDKINEYQKSNSNSSIDFDDDFEEDFINEDEKGIVEDFLFGKKNPISLSQIDASGSLIEFKEAIKKDKKSLKYILDNLAEFNEIFKTEVELKSTDTKFEELLKIIIQKQKTSNKKIIIFSAYKDTVEYLFNQLSIRGFRKFAMVAGDVNKMFGDTQFNKKHDIVLERFAPYTKLFKEKNWNEYGEKIAYESWLDNIKVDHPMVYDKILNSIDILITTDVLSEGQNLQDADMVINYDIHWNPVRVIQRVGRIDRIGSPNNEIQSINFWPAKDIDSYIKLKSRVEKRMAIMKIAGSEVIETFTDEFNEIAESENLEDQQNANLLRQMKITMEDLDGEDSLGFDDFSFDVYKQQLAEVFQEKRKELEHLPNGIFSGFEIEAKEKKGLIALFGVLPKKNSMYSRYELVHLDHEGNIISENQKVVLEFLSEHRKASRQVPKEIDAGKNEAILELQNILKKYVTLQNGEKGQAGEHHTDMLNNFFGGSKKVLEEIKLGHFQAEKKLDLITWMIVS
jgi:superfamily II DNA or RNA helicase